jgi:hypothetical protein
MLPQPRSRKRNGAILQKLKQVSGRKPTVLRRSLPLHVPIESVSVFRTQCLIVPGVKESHSVREFFRAMVGLQQGSEPDFVDFGEDTIEPPSHLERGHVVPPKLVPTPLHASGLCLILLIFHCGIDGNVTIELQVLQHRNEGIARECHWYPDTQPGFIPVLTTLLRWVFDCLVVVIACGGWSLQESCMGALQDLAQEHRLVFVFSRRLATKYLDLTDPTLISMLRFVVVAHTELPSFEGNMKPLNLISRLRDLAIRVGHRVLSDSAASTRPVIIDDQKCIIEIFPSVAPPRMSIPPVSVESAPANSIPVDKESYEQGSEDCTVEGDSVEVPPQLQPSSRIVVCATMLPQLHESPSDGRCLSQSISTGYVPHAARDSAKTGGMGLDAAADMEEDEEASKDDSALTLSSYNGATLRRLSGHKVSLQHSSNLSASVAAQRQEAMELDGTSYESVSFSSAGAHTTAAGRGRTRAGGLQTASAASVSAATAGARSGTPATKGSGKKKAKSSFLLLNSSQDVYEEDVYVWRPEDTPYQEGCVFAKAKQILSHDGDSSGTVDMRQLVILHIRSDLELLQQERHHEFTDLKCLNLKTMMETSIKIAAYSPRNDAFRVPSSWIHESPPKSGRVKHFNFLQCFTCLQKDQDVIPGEVITACDMCNRSFHRTTECMQCRQDEIPSKRNDKKTWKCHICRGEES